MMALSTSPSENKCSKIRLVYLCACR